jgi:hypothetical protein
MSVRSWRAHGDRMLRRMTALLLWVYFAWYLVGLIAAATGLPSSLGPMAAALMAVLAVVDWRSLRRNPDHLRSERAGSAS